MKRLCWGLLNSVLLLLLLALLFRLMSNLSIELAWSPFNFAILSSFMSSSYPLSAQDLPLARLVSPRLPSPASHKRRNATFIDLSRI
jgi:hypothetical protein